MMPHAPAFEPPKEMNDEEMAIFGKLEQFILDNSPRSELGANVSVTMPIVACLVGHICAKSNEPMVAIETALANVQQGFNANNRLTAADMAPKPSGKPDPFKRGEPLGDGMYSVTPGELEALDGMRDLFLDMGKHIGMGHMFAIVGKTIGNLVAKTRNPEASKKIVLDNIELETATRQ